MRVQNSFSRYRRSLPSACLLLLLMLFPRAQAQPEQAMVVCNENEAVVMVTVENPIDVQNQGAEWTVMAHYKNLEGSLDTVNLNITLPEVTVIIAMGCLPRETACLQVEVRQLHEAEHSSPPGIYYEGEGFKDVKGPFSSPIADQEGRWETIFVAESDACQISCDLETEIELELDFFVTPEFSEYFWQVSDSDNNDETLLVCDGDEPQSSCTKNSGFSKFTSEKYCLSGDACLDFYARGSYESTEESNMGGINITMNNQRIASLQHGQFSFDGQFNLAFPIHSSCRTNIEINETDSNRNGLTVAVYAFFGFSLLLGLYLVRYFRRKEREDTAPRAASNAPGVGRNGLGNGPALVDQAEAVPPQPIKRVSHAGPERPISEEGASTREETDDNSYC